MPNLSLKILSKISQICSLRIFDSKHDPMKFNLKEGANSNISCENSQ